MKRCLRCNGKIQSKTYNKYNGYSRQCFEKINQQTPTPVIDLRMTQILDDLLDYSIKKLRATIVKPQFYSREEYKSIWRANDYYYEKYLDNTIVKLLETDWLNAPIEVEI